MFEKTFTGTEDFEALDAAEQWCKRHGFSIGSLAGDLPVGLKRGATYLAKWYHLSKSDRLQLDGEITFPPDADPRRGPVVVRLKFPVD